MFLSLESYFLLKNILTFRCADTRFSSIILWAIFQWVRGFNLNTRKLGINSVDKFWAHIWNDRILFFIIPWKPVYKEVLLDLMYIKFEKILSQMYRTLMARFSVFLIIFCVILKCIFVVIFNHNLLTQCYLLSKSYLLVQNWTTLC